MKVLLLVCVLLSSANILSSMDVKTRAQQLLNGRSKDNTLNSYSNKDLSSLKKEFERIKSKSESIANHPWAERARYAVFSVPSVLLLVIGKDALREIFQASFRERMYKNDIPSLHEIDCQTYLGLGFVTAGALGLLHTLPRVFSSFKHEKSTVRRSGELINLINSKLPVLK